MATGFNGKVLHVDLTAGTFRTEEVSEIIYRRYLGGGARAAYFLLREQNVKQALNLAARAYVLENGQVILSGKPADVAESNHVRRAYLGI